MVLDEPVNGLDPEGVLWVRNLVRGLAAAFALAAVFTLLDLTVPVAVQIFGSVQALWWLAAAGTLLMRARGPSTAGPPSNVATTGHTTAEHLWPMLLRPGADEFESRQWSES